MIGKGYIIAAAASALCRSGCIKQRQDEQQQKLLQAQVVVD